MGRWVKILFIAVVIFAFLFTCAYFFMFIKAKSFVITTLENLTRKKITIGSLDLGFPLNLEIRNLDIQGLAKVDYIFVSPSILGALFGKIAFNGVKVIKPEIYLERQRPALSSGTVATETEKTDKSRRFFLSQKMPLIVKRLVIMDGKINFVDNTVRAEGIRITLKDIYCDIDNFYLIPKSTIANFQLKAKIPWQKNTQ